MSDVCVETQTFLIQLLAVAVSFFFEPVFTFYFYSPADVQRHGGDDADSDKDIDQFGPPRQP